MLSIDMLFMLDRKNFLSGHGAQAACNMADVVIAKCVQNR